MSNNNFKFKKDLTKVGNANRNIYELNEEIKLKSLYLAKSAHE